MSIQMIETEHKSAGRFAFFAARVVKTFDYFMNHIVV